MARAFYPHEVDDPDLEWLVTTFLGEQPNYIPVEAGPLPIILLPIHECSEPLDPDLSYLLEDDSEELKDETEMCERSKAPVKGVGSRTK